MPESVYKLRMVSVATVNFCEILQRTWYISFYIIRSLKSWKKILGGGGVRPLLVRSLKKHALNKDKSKSWDDNIITTWCGAGVNPFAYRTNSCSNNMIITHCYTLTKSKRVGGGAYADIFFLRMQIFLWWLFWIISLCLKV